MSEIPIRPCDPGSASISAMSGRQGPDPAAVSRLFAGIAPRYDLMNRLMTAGLDVGWRRRACELLGEPGPGPLLDAGTGTADLALTLVRCRPGAHVVGVDPSAPMLALGAAKLARAGCDGQVSLARGDALALPFPDASFAGVLSAFVLRNVGDLARALGEMRRVVAPGGPVLCLELSRPQAPVFRAIFRFYFTRLVPILGALVARNRAAYTYLPASVDAFPSPAALAAAMERAGLAGIRIVPLALGAATIHIGRRA